MLFRVKDNVKDVVDNKADEIETKSGEINNQHLHIYLFGTHRSQVFADVKYGKH